MAIPTSIYCREAKGQHGALAIANAVSHQGWRVVAVILNIANPMHKYQVWFETEAEATDELVDDHIRLATR